MKIHLFNSDKLIRGPFKITFPLLNHKIILSMIQEFIYSNKQSISRKSDFSCVICYDCEKTCDGLDFYLENKTGQLKLRQVADSRETSLFVTLIFRKEILPENTFLLSFQNILENEIFKNKFDKYIRFLKLVTIDQIYHELETENVNDEDCLYLEKQEKCPYSLVNNCKTRSTAKLDDLCPDVSITGKDVSLQSESIDENIYRYHEKFDGDISFINISCPLKLTRDIKDVKTEMFDLDVILEYNINSNSYKAYELFDYCSKYFL